jgi:hypothetical protein
MLLILEELIEYINTFEGVEWVTMKVSFLSLSLSRSLPSACREDQRRAD